ncbi:MAG TPA: hypothetical protein V6D34_05620 [Candidatus Sericytochromatia bacterium]|jgi:hypothetical protein
MQTLLEALEEYQKFRGNEANNIRSYIKKRVILELLSDLKIELWQHKSINVIAEQVPIAGFVSLASPIFEQHLLDVQNSNTRKVMKS